MKTENTGSTEAERRKQEINQRYDRKISRIFFPARASTLVGLSLFTGGMVKMIYDHIHTDYSVNSVHTRYIDINCARSYLVHLKKDLTFSHPEFRPNPENVNPYFNKVFGNSESRTKSIDDAIESASSELSELDKDPVRIAEKRNEYILIISSFCGLGLTFLGMGVGMSSQIALYSKRRKELEKLERLENKV
jgi:hypothetical protein